MYNLNEFKNFLILKNCSKNTVHNYIRCIARLLKVLGNKELDNNFVADYFLGLKEKHKPATINIVRAALVKFAEFIGKEIKLPTQIKVDRCVPDFMTEEFFIDNVLPLADTLEYDNAVKKKCILHLLFYGGLRNREVVKLKRAEINLKECYVKLKDTKTKRERIVPLLDETISLFKLYFMTEPEEINAFNLGNTGVSFLIKTLKQYVTDVNLRPNLFRHSCATYWLDKGLSLSEVQMILGHSTIEATAHYLGAINWKATKLKMEKLRRGK